MRRSALEHYPGNSSRQLCSLTKVAPRSTGPGVEEARLATELLRAQGVACSLLNLRFVRPLDTAAVLSLASRCKVLVTLEDHVRPGGIGEVVQALVHQADVEARVVSFALDTWFKPRPWQVVARCAGMTGERLANRIAERLKASGPRP